MLSIHGNLVRCSFQQRNFYPQNALGVITQTLITLMCLGVWVMFLNQTPSWEPISSCWQSTVVIPGDVFLVVIVIFVPEAKHWNIGFSSSSTGWQHLYNTHFEQQIFYIIKWIKCLVWWNLSLPSKFYQVANRHEESNNLFNLFRGQLYLLNITFVRYYFNKNNNNYNAIFKIFVIKNLIQWHGLFEMNQHLFMFSIYVYYLYLLFIFIIFIYRFI